MENSKDFYNKFSTYYSDYADSKFSYIKAVDNFIISNSCSGAEIIDIGSGDGCRAQKLSKALRANKLTLLDNSVGMIQRCKLIESVDVVYADISNEYFEHKHQYAIAICLWNVLGHIFDSDKRLIALKNIKSLIKDNGSIYLDVNNRYNVSQYGLLSVIKNMCKDLISRSNDNGNFPLKMIFDGKTISTKVHIFSSSEIENLIRLAGLRIEKKLVVNYSNGKLCKTQFCGQLVYKLSKI